METSHDLMRKAMAEHAITKEELIAHIHGMAGGDVTRIIQAVNRFVDGEPGCMAVHIAIVHLAVEQAQAIRH